MEVGGGRGGFNNHIMDKHTHTHPAMLHLNEHRRELYSPTKRARFNPETSQVADESREKGGE